MAVAPEYETVEAFVEFLMEDDREAFDAEDLQALCFSLERSSQNLRRELESWGLRLAHRPNERQVRGFRSNPHDRWYGPGSSRTCGGSGYEQISGFSGQEG